jgi:hypothetical protein
MMLFDYLFLYILGQMRHNREKEFNLLLQLKREVYLERLEVVLGIHDEKK